MRVLLVEDSLKVQRYGTEGLRGAGFAVDVAGDGEEALWAAESEAYDAIVLDIMLPKLDGLAVLEQLRDRGCEAQVLMLTARDTVQDRVTGLSKGADDYLVKPFAMAELVARVQSLTRRGYGVKRTAMQAGPLTIDTLQRTVTRGNRPIELQPREYALLEFLAMRKGEVVSRTEIEEHIYDSRAEPMSNVVDSAICQLRRKIDEADGPSLIETRRGMGYVLRDDQP